MERTVFQPSLPARGATGPLDHRLVLDEISTLAPREGSDGVPNSPGGPRPISTLAPREGSDSAGIPQNWTKHLFQPSLPARGATVVLMFLRGTKSFQPSLPARGATTMLLSRDIFKGISTLAPREGSDVKVWLEINMCQHFNPRSPRGERPLLGIYLSCLFRISTLAPREGSDDLEFSIASV